MNLEAAFRRMVLARAFEQRLLDLFAAGELMGTTHTCLGQEANAAGVALALNPDDIMVSNHRGHGHFLAHLGDVDGLMAEVMGKASGICGGWGGSQHLCVPGRFYANGIQGGTFGLAAGLALAERRKGSGKAVALFAGDGTFGEGMVYESLNLAAVNGAPLVVVVEDNGIAQTTPTAATTAGSLAARAAAFGLPCEVLDYPEADAVEAAAGRLLAHVRATGPAVLVIRSCRLGPHSKGDDTRPAAEIERLRALDPLARTAARLSPAVVEAAWAEAAAAIDAAVAAAHAAPWPTLPPPEPMAVGGTLPDDGIHGSMRERLTAALTRAMAANPAAVLLGEDVMAPYGGAFKVTTGLSTAFPGRVLACPISEAGMVGLAGGLALGGVPAVVEIMFGDFLGLAMDQLVNHLARYRGMYGGQVRCPVLVRTPMGGRRGYGPTHSQTLDKHFLGVTGLQVVAPSHLHPLDALVEQALAGDGPTLMIENKLAYTLRPAPGEPGMTGDFFLRWSGDAAAPLAELSLTGFEDEAAVIVAYGGMVPVALDAAEALLLHDEISVRVVAPCRLHPLEADALLAALPEGAAVLVAEEGTAPFGFGSELAALLAERGLLSGRRFARLGAAPFAIAASRPLEDAVLPQPADLVAALRAIV